MKNKDYIFTIYGKPVLVESKNSLKLPEVDDKNWIPEKVHSQTWIMPPTASECKADFSISHYKDDFIIRLKESNTVYEFHLSIDQVKGIKKTIDKFIKNNK